MGRRSISTVVAVPPRAHPTPPAAPRMTNAAPAFAMATAAPVKRVRRSYARGWVVSIRPSIRTTAAAAELLALRRKRRALTAPVPASRMAFRASSTTTVAAIVVMRRVSAVVLPLAPIAPVSIPPAVAMASTPSASLIPAGISISVTRASRTANALPTCAPTAFARVAPIREAHVQDRPNAATTTVSVASTASVHCEQHPMTPTALHRDAKSSMRLGIDKEPPATGG